MEKGMYRDPEYLLMLIDNILRLRDVRLLTDKEVVDKIMGVLWSFDHVKKDFIERLE